MNIYQKGDVARLKGIFTNDADVFIDPTNVFFSILLPNGARVDYTYLVNAELLKDSTGHYHVEFDLPYVGYYKYRFYSTGVGKAADEAVLEVEHSDF